jgi:hypothetical protein
MHRNFLAKVVLFFCCLFPAQSFSGAEPSPESNTSESSSSLISTNKIDIDGNEKFDALTDGLLLLRSMFELSGGPLITGVVADDAVYTSSSDIETRITALGDRIDIDDDGRIDALTDGLLILRYLFELSGDALTAGVISDGAQRASAVDIESYLLKLTTFSPVFTSGATFSAAENQTSIGTVTATDADIGDSVTFTVSGSELAITSGGVLSFASAPDYETKASYTAIVAASDGTNTTTQDITVNVTNVNDNSPVFTSSATFSAAENQTSIGTVTATDADSGDLITFTVSGSELAITLGGVLSFKTAADYETKPTYTATVTVSDGTNTETQAITVNVSDANDNAPIIESSPVFSAAENQTSIGTVTATDGDSSSITFTVSGSELAITSAGVLSFASAPDYETKASYTATVTASDGTNTTTQAITVNVTNVNDNSPVFTSSATFSAAENQTSIGTVTATDADGDTINFSLAGTDASLLSVNSSTGVLTFNSSVDYETKSTYSVTTIASDGANSAEQNITVNVNDVPENVTGEAFTGKAIDGYISGAMIFIDQNFNFKHDSGEYAGLSDANGAFSIIVDSSIASCLKARPIIANVPVGAVDSTLGTVEQAYQMILPSINDTGNSSIVISPFTSLFAEAILSSKSDISKDLTVTEGCESNGDAIASKISSRIVELKASIESNFGISYDQLLSDFIENPTDDVDETSAQNIAKLLPYLQIIDNQVSGYLTESFSKNIRANVSLSEDSLSIIFDGSNYEKLPLDFYSNYETRPNDKGWFRSETLDASGAFISKDGVLSREDCSETDKTLCNLTELSLENIANTSTSYRKTSSFSKSTPVNFDELGITNGSLSVSSTISSAWRDNSENWDEPYSRTRECQKSESIDFSTGNRDVDAYISRFSYNNYSQGFEKADCNDVRHYYTPLLNASTFLSDDSGSSLGAQYYIFDVLRSGISSNLPYDFVDNSVNINPELVVKDIAVLPRMYKDLDTIRGLFKGDDYVLFGYDKNSGLAAYFEAGTNPSNDMFWDYELEASRIYGQAARTAFFNKLKEDPNLTEDFYGESVPTNTSVLGRIANSYIEITDYNGSNGINLQVTPTYDYETKTLDYSVKSSLDLENIKDFIENGINGNPLNSKIWYNPDGSLESTVPLKLYLYEGDDSTIDANESYFEMSFNLTVSSSSSGNSNRYEATQVWIIEKGSEILVTYTEDGVTLSQTVTNIDEDKITLTESNTGDTADSLDSYIDQPSNLNLKLLTLISKVSDRISGVQNFFTDGGTYTIELDLGSGGHSLIDFNRNTVKNITGTFTTKSSPDYAISVNDIIINEGNSKNICFDRPSSGDLSATEFDLSFTQRERPGKGGFADDFTLSDTTIVFNESDVQSCTTFSAIQDTHFDWAHDIYLDISEPSNGQSLSRTRIKITILDVYFPNRIDWRRR